MARSVCWIVICCCLLSVQNGWCSGSIADGEQYGWAENAGWVNWKNAYASVNVEDGYLTGYLWSENVGWIKLGSDGGGPYANTTADNWGVNWDSNTGLLSGYAWSENAGWINFDAGNAQALLDPDSGVISGYVWSENMGWISLSGTAQDASSYGVTATGIDTNTGGDSGGGSGGRTGNAVPGASGVWLAFASLVLMLGAKRQLRQRAKGGQCRVITRIFLPLVLLGCLLLPAAVWAGELSAPAAPDDASSAMYTLEDIYNRLDAGTTGAKRSGGFSAPDTGPTASTGRTLDEVMAKAPEVDDSSGASAADVVLGKTFWGLSSGAWGLQTGTKETVYLASHIVIFEQMKGVVLVEADCESATLTVDGDIYETDFTNANLSRATLNVDGSIYFTDFTNANLSSAELYVKGDINLTDFTNANLSEAELIVDKIYETDFTNANLTGAELDVDYIIRADFTNADLRGATGLGSATITYDAWNNTTCSDGSNSDDNGDTCLGHLF